MNGVELPIRMLPTPFNPRALRAVLLATLALPLSAQRRDDFARTVEPRTDQTIFTELTLPTPNRLRTAAGAPGPDYWQQQVDYAIEASIDPATRTISGKERVTYHNNSPEALEYLWVNLEQNVLRQDSLGSQIGGGRAVGGASEPSDGVRIGAVSAGGSPLSYQVYDTMMRVDLPQPLAAGKKFDFDISWQFQMPERVFRRHGILKVRKGLVFEVAQWFPAVAVYDDVHGWNHLPYLGNGEFYTNFGDYDLKITAPREHLVVATGALQNPEQVYTKEQLQRLEQAKTSAETVIIRSKEEVGDPKSRPAGEGPLTWHFKAERVRTCAWATSETFVLDAAGLDGILVQSAYHEDAPGVWQQSTQMLRTAIAGYNKRLFPYPYPVATNVAGVEGGMEYPMIIFCRGGNERGLYGVTTHENGHNWFPMPVNTDERRHAWMDEGFNTFINIYSTADWFEAPSGGGGGRRGGRAMPNPGVPIMTEADHMGGLLGMLGYQKPADGLRPLREHILGAERFDHAFRTYIRRWAFKSPQPADFFRTMEDASGMDLDWFWRGWIVESASLDQAVGEVQQGQGNRGASITFTNLERMVMPLHFTATFEDGTTESRQLPVQVWFTSNRVQQRLTTAKKVTKVEVDAERIWPDASRGNNVWEAK